MLIFLNGQRNLIIFPKETLEELNKPKYFQISSDGKGILIRYSNRKQLAEACTVEYPLKANSYGFHLRDEKVADALRKRYGWDDYLYAIDVIPFLRAFAIDPAYAQKTNTRNVGL